MIGVQKAYVNDVNRYEPIFYCIYTHLTSQFHVTTYLAIVAWDKHFAVYNIYNNNRLFIHEVMRQ